MELKIEESKSIVHIHIGGEFHIGNISEFEPIWHGLVEKKPEKIAIDCAALSYIDSSAIGTLVKFLNSAMSKDIKLVFYDLSPAIQNIFKTARLDKFFTITTKDKI